MDNNASSHYIIGITILSWICLQFILGIVNRILYYNSFLPMLSLIKKMHRLSGYILMVLTKSQILIGWKHFDKDLAFIILICWLITISIMLIIFLNF